MIDCEYEERKSQAENKLKKECSYGERCYRKNPAHFDEFEHTHLNKLLETLNGNDLESLPQNLKPKISVQTVQDQLEIIRNLNSRNNPIPQGGKLGTIQKSEKEPRSSVSSLPRKRHSTAGPKSDLTDKVSQPKKGRNKGSGSTTESNTSSCSTSVSQGNKVDEKNMSGTSTLSSEEHRKRMHQANNLGEAMNFLQEVKKRSQGSIAEKHEAAIPYYFFLTSVTDSKKTHSEPQTILMHDILDPSLGDLESSLQINFMVQFGWLMAQYLVANQRGKPLTLLYGEMDVENLKFNNVTAVQVKPPSPFGSHHTKMCVLAYTDGSLRVCVHTANLVESDWDNRVQGVWLSPSCPALPLDADSNAGESRTQFKQDLIQYLSEYRLPELQPWIGKLRRADFSAINVFFVASTPGSHKGVDSSKWGLPKLASLLQRHAQIEPRSGAPPSSWQVIAQCSSIGSLGPKPTSWFCGEVKQAMSAGIGLAIQSPPPIRLIYPSFDNVAGSYDGLLGGGCLPYSNKTHSKQDWLQQYLFQWKCDARHRTRAMPHIKTYTRVSPDLSRIAWFHLTSANLSKAAWGTRTKAGATTILSYEAGVLFLPKFIVGSTSFPIKTEAQIDVPVFPMPYDLPLTQYSSQDVPWFIENLS